MLLDSEKSLLRECLKGLRQLPGYSARRGQLQMVGAIAQAFAKCDSAREQTRVVVEAGTGTGKTAAYLMAAIALAKARKKHLVVSSSTVALQEQLVGKDLPTFRKLWPIEFSFALAKGRLHYACLAKLHDRAAEGTQQQLGLNADRAPAGDDSSLVGEQLRALEKQFSAGAWDGDRDSLGEPLPEATCQAITTDRQGCTGSKCVHFAKCPFYAAKDRIKNADVIVANHSLVLAALRMEAGSVLPDPAQTLFVLDEAHTLPGKVVELFAARHGLRGSIEWIADSAKTVRDIVLALGLDQAFYHAAERNAGALCAYLDDLFRTIDRTKAFDERPARRFRNGVIPDWCRQAGENIESTAAALQETFASMREAMLAKTAGSEALLVQRLLASFGFYVARLQNLLDTWRLMLDRDQESEPTARWLERHEHDYQVCASPISAAGRLRQYLWNTAGGVALTSATLTACGSFDSYLRQCGLDANTQTLKVASPFDYERARLVVPVLKSDPRHDTAHTQEVVQLLPRLIDTLGTLVLFASAKQMRNVYEGLPPALKTDILMQGHVAKRDLLTRHRSRIARGERSVLFGLASLAEGVDLRGDQCEHVVICKIQFSVPTSPLEEAKAEWIERNGGSAFAEMALPEAAIRLAQAVGRLLRTESDHGRITILDRRLITARWGIDMLRGLPPFKLEIAGRERDLRSRRSELTMPGAR